MERSNNDRHSAHLPSEAVRHHQGLVIPVPTIFDITPPGARGVPARGEYAMDGEPGAPVSP